MSPRTWPVLRLVFSRPLDESRREALLLDVDDCRASALDENGETVSLHFNAAADRDAAVDLLGSRGWLADATLTTEDLADEGWAARSQANLPAVRVGRVVVAPPWDVPAAGDGEGLVVIEVEPSTGFGTGHHQSTRLCLRALQDLSLEGARVLDIGTGSGVLALAAARLGAADVLATDVDPLAVEATQENIESNGVAAVVRVELEPGEIGVPEWENDARPGLAEEREKGSASRAANSCDEITPASNPTTHRAAKVDAATPERASMERGTRNSAVSGGFAACVPASFDVVVANILADTLVEMRSMLTSAVRPGGTLVLSGIEARRLKSVEEAFIRSPWCLKRTIIRGDWVSLSLHHEVLAEPNKRAS
jgi:ribosomal protein L11 methyltransferase